MKAHPSPGAAVACAALLALSCGTAQPRPAQAPSAPLVGPEGKTQDVRTLAASAPWTVLVFFSPGCHCLKVHEPRLRALYEAEHPRGVQFAMIDSEVRGTEARDLEEARQRGYPFPILRDPGAKLASVLGATYATYTVVLDAQANVHYRGGIDSDKTHLHDEASTYLKDALESLLNHQEPQVREGKTLGCALETW